MEPSSQDLMFGAIFKATLLCYMPDEDDNVNKQVPLHLVPKIMLIL